MITDLLIDLIYAVVLLIVNLFSGLPDVTISAELTNSITAIAPYFASLSMIFPIATLFLILSFELVYETAYLLYKLIRWAYIKIPFVN